MRNDTPIVAAVVPRERPRHLRTLFHESNLFGLFGLVDSNARIDVLGSGRLVFDRLEIRQTLEETFLGDADVMSSHIRTRGTGLDRQPSYSPDGEFVVYTSNRRGNLDLYLSTGTETPTNSRAIHSRTGIRPSLPMVSTCSGALIEPTISRSGKRGSIGTASSYRHPYRCRPTVKMRRTQR